MIDLRDLRNDVPLATGYVITLEPGLYFIPPLLDPRAPRPAPRHRELVPRRRPRGFGGIRIEDNVHVTDRGPEILTAAVPKALGAAVPV